MQRLRRFSGWGIVTMALFFTACATMSVDRNRLAKVKNVAVAGFTVNQEIPPGFTWNLSGSGRDGGAVDWGGGIGVESPHATQIYSNLQERLHQEFKWNFVSADRVASTPAYAALYKDKMKGFQSRPPAGRDMKAFGAKGIVDAFPVERLSPLERDSLMDALKVDSLIIATLDVKLEKGGGLERLVGAGEYMPKASLRFAVYSKGNSEPVWQDFSAQGAELKEGARHVFGATVQEKVNEKVILAAKNSYQKLIEHYKEQKS